MKKLLLIISIAVSISANAQDDKTVTLVVSGQGKTQDEAKQNALRSAIEQAFGTFISSKTEILNDNLIKDEIVSVTNGNIQKFEPISEVQLPDGSYATTLKAIVSVSKLTSFCESKGVEVEFKGATFAMNIKLQKLNEEAEYKAILNLCEVSKDILSKSLNYSLVVEEPTTFGGSNDNFSLKFVVHVMSNNNTEIFYKYFWKTLSEIAITVEEKENYEKLKKVISKVIKFNGNSSDKQDIIYLRNPKSLLALKNLLLKSNESLVNFRIISEIDTIFVKKWRGPDSWDLNYGHGYPAAGRFTTSLRKENSIFEKDGVDYSYAFIHIENTGDIYHQLLNSTRKPSVLSDSKSYFTSTYYDNFSQYNNDNEGIICGGWLAEIDPNNFVNMDLIIHDSKFQTTNYSFDFHYNHILTLSKLEKISKYRIEPWFNDTINSKPSNKALNKYNYITDNENLFTNQQITVLDKIISDFEKATSNEIAIVTDVTLGDFTNIEEYAVRLANKMGVGKKDKNNGILLVISKKRREIFISTGLGTEQILNNSKCQEIVSETIIPYFKKNEYYLGVKAGLEEIIKNWTVSKK